MKIQVVALVLVLLGAQADPVEAARKELGGTFTCELVEKGVVLASDADAAHVDALKASLKKAVAALREQAFEPAPSNAILVVSFKDTEGFKAYTGKRYADSFELPAFYDPVRRRLLVHADIAEPFAAPSVLTFLLGEHLGTPLPAPWVAAAVVGLDETPEEAEAIFDPHAALLQGALRRGTSPALSALLKMSLADFRAPGRSGLHGALSKKLGHFLKAKGLLLKFFAEFKKTTKRDPSGTSALEAAAGKKVDAVEKDFAAWLKGLPWVRDERFREHAKKGFSGEIRFKSDDDLFLAIATDADEAAVTRALGEARKLHAPLIRYLDLQPSGLPVIARIFKDEASFQGFAKMDKPERGWFAGYYIPRSRSISINLSADPTALTHEFCHSLFEDDLGVLPPWTGEGLPSLFQDFRLEKDVPLGERGQTVKEVLAALEQGRLPALADLVQMRGQGFYGDRSKMHLHYQLARAVFLYLQEKEKLLDFYRNLKATHAANRLAPPITMCRDALEKALGMKVAAIDEDFRKWVAAPPGER